MAAGEAYSLYVEPAVEGANEADGPFSASCAEVPQQPARAAAVADEAALVHGAHAVDPDAVKAHRGRVEAGRAGRQVVDAPLGAAAHRLRIEEHEVGPGAGHEGAAV